MGQITTESRGSSDRPLLYHVSLSVVGGSLFTFGLSAILDGSVRDLASAGDQWPRNVLNVVYERLSGNFPEAASEPRVVRLVTLGAVLVLVGTGFQAL